MLPDSLELVWTEYVSYLPKVASAFSPYLTRASQASLTCLLRFQNHWRIIFPAIENSFLSLGNVDLFCCLFVLYKSHHVALAVLELIA